MQTSLTLRVTTDDAKLIAEYSLLAFSCRRSHMMSSRR